MFLTADRRLFLLCFPYHEENERQMQVYAELIDRAEWMDLSFHRLNTMMRAFNSCWNENFLLLVLDDRMMKHCFLTLMWMVGWGIPIRRALLQRGSARIAAWFALKIRGWATTACPDILMP
jgi:hypothetical protein